MLLKENIPVARYIDLDQNEMALELGRSPAIDNDLWPCAEEKTINCKKSINFASIGKGIIGKHITATWSKCFELNRINIL